MPSAVRGSGTLLPNQIGLSRTLGDRLSGGMAYYWFMPNRRHSLPEHDLTLHLVHGTHTCAEAIQFFRSLDANCATRWLSYFDPTVDMSQIDIASVPEIKHVVAQKQEELFGEHAKAYAIVCGSESSEQYFFGFWQRYFVGPGVQSESTRCFRSLDEAYAWLGLSDAGRAAVARAIEDWEKAGSDLAHPEPRTISGSPGADRHPGAAQP